MSPPPMPLAPPFRYTMSSTPRPAPNRCSATAPRLASLPTDAGRPVASSTSARSGASVHPRCGARRTSPSDARTSPGTASPTATMRASPRASDRQRATVPATSSAVSSGVTTWSTSRRSRTMISPSRPTAAIVTASTSGFTVMAVTPGCGATTGDGRPTRLVGSGARSTTRPDSTSSDASAATVERLSPVAAVSRARESGPSRCTSVRSFERFRRCTPSKVPARSATRPL